MKKIIIIFSLLLPAALAAQAALNISHLAGDYYVYTTYKDLDGYLFPSNSMYLVTGEGHSRDNIVIWFPDLKILFGGCLVKSVESQGLGNTADANLREWGPSVRRVMKKYPKAKYVIPGHFGWKSRNGLKHTLKLLKRL
jgi:glyoxylase-like metal-dependent hydrolase (beta-lactamase superfamily II)